MEKIARICYNENAWSRPSGVNGKGTLKDSYEYKHRFGHEEWLFDDERFLKGYHYSYLQALSGFLYAGETFDIHLYVYSKTHGKLYLGIIRNVECIDKIESDWAFNQYVKRGWLSQMEEDVKAIHGDYKQLRNSDYPLFNIRFRREDVHVNLSNPKIISQDDPSTRAKYYKLYDKKGDFVFSNTPDTRRTLKLKSKKSGQTLPSKRSATESKSEKRIIFNTDVRKTSYDPRHNRMQNAIRDILVNSGLYTSVEMEVNFVDITATTASGKVHFYEIKTSPAKASIREALGQVMEYAFYPTEKKADKLIIVAPVPADELDVQYIKMLRKEYHIPVWFQYYSIPEKKLFPLQ